MKIGNSDGEVSIDVTGDAAPLCGRERRPVFEYDSSAKIGKRLRRRGPRSLIANLRRRTKLKHAPPEVASGPAGADTSGIPSEMPNGNSDIDLSNQQPDICITLCINIRVLLKNGVELARLVEQHQPHLICLQETWLNESIKFYQIVG